MKIAVRISLLSIAGILVLAGCAHFFTLARQDFQVNLQVVGSPSELKVTSPGSPKCRKENQGNGCIHVAKNDTARTTFRLNAGPQWFFSKYKICKGNVKDQQDCNLEIWERIEFIVTTDSEQTLLIPGADGMVDLTALSVTNIQEFIDFDSNLIKQDYFYSIEVCNVDPAVDCLWTDPVRENRGKGN